MKITESQLRRLIREQVDNPYNYNRLRKAEQDLHSWENQRHQRRQPELDEDDLFNTGFEDAINERSAEYPYDTAYMEGYVDGQTSARLTR